MKDKDFKPLIMWFCLVTGIIVIAFIRANRCDMMPSCMFRSEIIKK